VEIAMNTPLEQNGAPSMASVNDAIAAAWPLGLGGLWGNEPVAALASLAEGHVELRQELIELVRGIVRDREPAAA
jgi:hypothetical protein